MKLELLLLLAIGIYGVILAFKYKGKLPKAISLGQLIFIALVLTKYDYAVKLGFLVLFCSIILTIIYGIKAKELNKLTRTTIVISGLIILLNFVYRLSHWPVFYGLQFTPFIPLILMVIAFLKEPKFSKELSFMIFWFMFIVISYILP